VVKRCRIAISKQGAGGARPPARKWPLHSGDVSYGRPFSSCTLIGDLRGFADRHSLRGISPLTPPMVFTPRFALRHGAWPARCFLGLLLAVPAEALRRLEVFWPESGPRSSETRNLPGPLSRDYPSQTHSTRPPISRAQGSWQ